MALAVGAYTWITVILNGLPWKWTEIISSFLILHPSIAFQALLFEHELLIAIIRLKLEKVGKVTRSFSYDLNQIPYDYTLEVTNRFKGLDLIECMKSYRWKLMILYRGQWSRPSPRKRNAKIKNSCLRRSYKYLRKEEKLKVKEKRKDKPIWMQSSKEYQGEIRESS